MAGMLNKTLILRPLIEDRDNFLFCGGAILKIKREQTTTAHFSPVSFKKNQSGNYYILIANDFNNFNCYPLTNPPDKQAFNNLNVDLDKVISVCVLFEDNENVLPVAFTSTHKDGLKIRDLIDCYEKDYKTAKNTKATQATAQQQKEYEQANERLHNEQQALNQTSQPIYDDEAVAETNYYQEYEQQNQFLKGENYEPIREQTCPANEQAQPEKQAQQTCHNASGYEDAQGNNSSPAQPQYYLSIKEKLDALYQKYPPISALSALIPQSKWVKIPYDKTNYYAIGTVFENNLAKYVVYGIAGNRQNPPKQLSGCCYFIPESPYKPLEAGYWCLFQCAYTGKEIKPE